MEFKLAQIKDLNEAMCHRVFLNPSDYQTLAQAGAKDAAVYASINGYVFLLDKAGYLEKGTVGLNKKHREFLSLSLSLDKVVLKPFSLPSSEYKLSHTKIDMTSLKNDFEKELDDQLLEKFFRSLYKNVFLYKGFELYFEFQGNAFFGKVVEIMLVDSAAKRVELGYGMVDFETEFEFSSSPTSKFRIKSNSSRLKAIVRPDFKFEDMGVGGLDKEIQDIFRRAFSSRRIPASILQKYGISHVKGLLLYGPPGTGKTLIARQLAKVLHSKEPKIVNGPELFNKYVGETEAKVRGLFDDAKRDQQTLGTNSPLHVIIFDEFDSIAKHRGMDSSGTGVGDNVVNQLLAMIDGVEALENILVIGMTNRIDLIDKAVLRPGRFEVHIEIGLPDESGRLQILKIHTKNMASNNLLDGRVDQPLIAKMMKNYTGAEIEAVVKSASSFSLNRCHQLMDFTKNPDISQPGKVEMQDFLKALEEVKPEFGVDSERLEICAGSEFFDYGPRLSEIMSNSRKIIGQISDGSLKTASVLLYGPKGSGKTTLAAKLGLSSGFPFIKMVSSEDLIGKTEYYKTNFLIKTFDDAYKSPNALVILDDFERLVEYVDVRKSFNNNILQALLVLIKKRPSKRDNSICVLCTSSSPAFLREFEVFDEFNIKIEVPELLVGAKVDEVKMVIDQKLQGRAPSRMNLALGFRIPIKKLVFILSVTEKDKSGKAFDQLFEEALKVVNND